MDCSKPAREYNEDTNAVLPESAKVACQGIAGSYAQEAASNFFRYPEYVYRKTFEDVFLAVESGLCEYGVLPIENSCTGKIREVCELLEKHSVRIAGIFNLKINHHLMIKKDASEKDIQKILSHEQALMQSSEFLEENYPDAKLIACANTAVAAQIVAESEDGHEAAVCSPRCEDMYNLKIAARSIQNMSGNFTRFICITQNK